MEMISMKWMLRYLQASVVALGLFGLVFHPGMIGGLPVPSTAWAEAPPDSDGDGIPDTEDDCPNEAGAALMGGCPCYVGSDLDSDCDGVPDIADDYYGPGSDPGSDGDSGSGTGGGSGGGGSSGGGSSGGGPVGGGSSSGGGGNSAQDRDNDGVTDSHDECPDVHGLVSNNGCPDSTANCTPGIIAAGVAMILAQATAAGVVGSLGGPVGVAGAIAWYISHVTYLLGATFAVLCAIAYFTD